MLDCRLRVLLRISLSDSLKAEVCLVVGVVWRCQWLMTANQRIVGRPVVINVHSDEQEAADRMKFILLLFIRKKTSKLLLFALINLPKLPETVPVTLGYESIPASGLSSNLPTLWLNDVLLNLKQLSGDDLSSSSGDSYFVGKFMFKENN